VLYETVEAETIIVNLDSGTYYDLNQTGSFILSLIERQASIGEVTLALGSAYDVDIADAARDVEALVDQLAGEQLILVIEEHAEGDSRVGTAESDVLQPAPTPNGPVARVAYSEPELHKYTDMQELLLLDPVHEVDESGWPRRA